jgi:predicted esterase
MELQQTITQDQTVIIHPTLPHTHTVIFLHGRGDTATNFKIALLNSHTSQGLSLPQALPSLRWVFPQAPLRESARFPDAKATPQWFDVWDQRNHAEREAVQVEGLRESVQLIQGIVKNEVTLLDGRWESIVLAGLSQGGATVVHTLLNTHRSTVGGVERLGRAEARVGALMGFSTYLPLQDVLGMLPLRNSMLPDLDTIPSAGVEEWRKLDKIRKALGLNGGEGDNEAVLNTPILLEHCVDDATIFVQQGRELRQALEGLGARVTWKEYPDGKHWFNSPKGMDDVVWFLNSALGLGLGRPGHDDDSGPRFSSWRGCFYCCA